MMTTLYIGFGITVLLLLLEIGLLLVIGQRIEAVFEASMVQMDHKLAEAIAADHKLAEAIAAVMEKVPGFSEEGQEFNPIQAAIAQLIGNMAEQNKNTINARVIERTDGGLFAEKSD